MPYRPRELVIRAREAAILLLRTIDRNETVQRFLDLYAAQYRRPGRADQPWHYREQLETIRREAILAMVLRIEMALPRKLNVHVSVRESRPKQKRAKAKKGAKARSKKPSRTGLDLAIPLLDLFREEFFVALGQALEWNDDDARDFWRDLELYETLSAVAAQKSARKPLLRGQIASSSGPFVDRVGFLLDPSLMEQARREAGKFEVELHGIADQILRKTFAPRVN
ncbi:MAG TPA: hypothetical protein VNU84_01110 [Candidatus Acidoferrum sp.]|jgi:hypothetical protein|nr:hypothetical protein [Candidatus Acidoferrum sp.]